MEMPPAHGVQSNNGTEQRAGQRYGYTNEHAYSAAGQESKLLALYSGIQLGQA